MRTISSNSWIALSSVSLRVAGVTCCLLLWSPWIVAMWMSPADRYIHVSGTQREYIIKLPTGYDDTPSVSADLRVPRRDV